MATTASFALALCMLAAAYVTLQCITPPNPPPPLKSSIEDRIGWVATQSRLTTRRNTLLLIWLYHILLTITYPHPPLLICPQPGSLDPNLFGWSIHTVICIAMALIGGGIRLTAYSQLGRNFTFQLAKPKMLVKRGLYRYVQHPSYTGLFLILVAHLLLFSRRAGAVACWMPGILDIRYLDVLVWTLMIGASVVLGRMRIRDEENMLKKEFGKEWEEYHAKTKRLIPGLF
jgi:protein-S-isoprenylcysteine O-methyltransferase Ste14